MWVVIVTYHQANVHVFKEWLILPVIVLLYTRSTAIPEDIVTNSPSVKLLYLYIIITTGDNTFIPAINTNRKTRSTMLTHYIF